MRRDGLSRRGPALDRWLPRLALAAAVKGRILFRDGLREGTTDFLRLLPKVLLGVVGSGYVAAIMPADVTARYLGPESGLSRRDHRHRSPARLRRAGRWSGFSIGAAALKSGAGAPQVIAYSTAWALFAVQRLLPVGIADHAAAAGVDPRARVAAAAVYRGGRGDAAREALTFNAPPSALRGMMAPRCRTFSAARRCAAVAAASGLSPARRAAR